MRIIKPMKGAGITFAVVSLITTALFIAKFMLDKEWNKKYSLEFRVGISICTILIASLIGFYLVFCILDNKRKNFNAKVQKSNRDLTDDEKKTIKELAILWPKVEKTQPKTIQDSPYKSTQYNVLLTRFNTKKTTLIKNIYKNQKMNKLEL